MIRSGSFRRVWICAMLLLAHCVLSAQGEKFIEEESYHFPEEVIARWGAMSCSGGSWGPDGMLYTTGHDLAEAYVLRIAGKKLEYVRTEGSLGLAGLVGQAIAWDRSSEQPALWGIVKNKGVFLTGIPGAGANPP